jgi:branched-chain amino acid transport system permease protein
MRRAGVKPVVMVMTSIGVMLTMQGLLRLFAGTGTRQLYVDTDSKDIYRIPFGGRDLVITEPQLLLFVTTIVAVVALHLFLTRSRMGKAMRAVSDNPDLARVSGISIDHVVRTTWLIAGALAAAGGTLLALDVTLKPDLSYNIILPIFAAAIVGGVGQPYGAIAGGTLLALDVTLKPDLSYNIILPIFAAAIVGGVGQPYGAIAGGLLVGFTETLAVFNWSVLLRPLRPYLPEFVEIPAKLAFVPTEYKIVVPFFILVAVLIWRPTGIFKGRVNS